MKNLAIAGAISAGSFLAVEALVAAKALCCASEVLETVKDVVIPATQTLVG